MTDHKKPKKLHINPKLRAEFERLKKQFDELYQIKLNKTRRITRDEFNKLEKQLIKLEQQVASK